MIYFFQRLFGYTTLPYQCGDFFGIKRAELVGSLNGVIELVDQERLSWCKSYVMGARLSQAKNNTQEKLCSREVQLFWLLGSRT
jgi:hypothetical protein